MRESVNHSFPLKQSADSARAFLKARPLAKGAQSTVEVLADDHATPVFFCRRQNTTLTVRPSHTIEGGRHAPVTPLRVA